jgi:hypothetical protein
MIEAIPPLLKAFTACTGTPSPHFERNSLNIYLNVLATFKKTCREKAKAYNKHNTFSLQDLLFSETIQQNEEDVPELLHYEYAKFPNLFLT